MNETAWLVVAAALVVIGLMYFGFQYACKRQLQANNRRHEAVYRKLEWMESQEGIIYDDDLYNAIMNAEPDPERVERLREIFREYL